jgi:predicted molibdopterin-dependent oxidoreductase YjgC
MRWVRPEQEAAKRTVCPFCGMGCTLLIRPGTGAPVFDVAAAPTLDYDAGGPDGGSLCAKGNMTLELLTHPRRLEQPLLRVDGSLRPVPWECALGTLVDRFAGIRDEEGPGAVGIMIGPHLTMEEVRLAAKAARALGTGNLDACMPEDRPMTSGLALSGARPEPVRSPAEIESMTAMLVVGDLLTVAPCMAKPMLKARYRRRHHLLGVLDAAVTRTGWFAKPMLRCLPGMETAALAMLLKAALPRAPEVLPWREAAARCFERLSDEQLAAASGLDASAAAWLVGALVKEKDSGVFFTPSFGGRYREVLVAGLAALLAEATGSRFLAMPVGPNAIGVARVLSEEGFPVIGALTAAEMIDAAVTGKLKALLALGCDPLASFPGAAPRLAARRLAFFAAAGPVSGEGSEFAHLVLPTSVWGERSGTVVNAFLAETSLDPVLPPPGAARPHGEILEALAAGIAGPPPEKSEAPASPGRFDFFDELELFFRLARRGQAGEAGTRVLLPRNLPAHSGDGALTRFFSWPRHEAPEAAVSISPAHAAEIGVEEGQPVMVRSRHGEARAVTRIESRVPEGTVLAPPHWPAIRSLMRFRLNPVLGQLDFGPGRVTVEAMGGESHG